MPRKQYWLVSKVTCLVCEHKWIGAYPDAAPEDHLECPRCNAQMSDIVERYGPDEKEELAESDPVFYKYLNGLIEGQNAESN